MQNINIKMISLAILLYLIYNKCLILLINALLLHLIMDIYFKFTLQAIYLFKMLTMIRHNNYLLLLFHSLNFKDQNFII